MKQQERDAWKQIGYGFALIVIAVILGYLVSPFGYVLALLGAWLIIGGWTDTRYFPNHPDYKP